MIEQIKLSVKCSKWLLLQCTNIDVYLKKVNLNCFVIQFEVNSLRIMTLFLCVTISIQMLRIQVRANQNEKGQKVELIQGP